MVLKKKPYYSLILSAVLLLQLLVLTITISPKYAEATHWKMESGPNDRGKFIAYTNNVELKGTVIYNEDGNLFIVPDENYKNLLTKGNYKYPFGRHNGYEWYRDNIETNLRWLGFSTDPFPGIIKIEGYGYCERVGSSECYPDAEGSAILLYENGTGVRILDEDGNIDEAQAGDRIRITGVYALDNGHSWYYGQCDFPSARWEGAEDVSPKICFNHAELHPRSTGPVTALEPLNPGEPNVESHIVVAPIYEEYYSHSYPVNWAMGLSCGANAARPLPFLGNGILCGRSFTKLVDSSVKTDITSEFFIRAPPKPAECTPEVSCQLTLQESNIKKIGNAEVVEKVRQENGWLIRVRAVGTDNPWNPSIYQATWSVGWSALPGNIDNIDPDTSITRAESLTGSVISNSSSTPHTSIRFTYAGTDNIAVGGFACSLDGSSPSPCPGNTISYNQLTPGTHTFQVAAIDQAGNVDKTPATFTWTIREGADIPRICIIRPWLPQCDPNQQPLTTQETSPPPSEQEAATTNTTEDESVQESTDMTSSPEAQAAVTEPLTVQIIPNATQGIVPATFQFDANIAGGTEPYTLTWNIGEDRTESNEERVLHTFNEAGTYDVTLTATDSDGETLSDSIELQVLEPQEDESLQEEGGESEEEDNNTANAETDERDEEDTSA